MTHISNNGFNYQGIVKISKMRGDKVVSSHITHNKGTNFFFKILCNILASKNLADLNVNLPNYLDAGNLTTDNQYTSLLIRPTIISQKDVIQNIEVSSTDNPNSFETFPWGAKFSVLITYPNIKQNSNIDTINCLRLMTSEIDSNILAEVRLDEATQINLKDNVSAYNYMIEWIMTFQNK